MHDLGETGWDARTEDAVYDLRLPLKQGAAAPNQMKRRRAAMEAALMRREPAPESDPAAELHVPRRGVLRFVVAFIFGLVLHIVGLGLRSCFLNGLCNL